MVLTRYFGLTLALMILAGCASSSMLAAAPKTAAKTPEDGVLRFEPPQTAEGSLWSQTMGVTLFSDRRARNVGDIVTVRIVEDPEAELNANTKTSRSSSVTAAKLKFLGYMKALADKNSRLAQSPGTDDLILSSLGLNFDGQATSDRDGHVKAYIAAAVEQVLPNGNLYISGKRALTVNNETQYISLSGIIRAEDISPYNEIASTCVASAKIAYSGKGPLADKQQPGWLLRILDHVWPF